MRNVTVNSADQPYYLVGYPNDHIDHIDMVNCVFKNVKKGPEVKYVDELELHNVQISA